MQHSIWICLFLLGMTAFQIHTLSGTDWFDKEVPWRLESDDMFSEYDPKPILNKAFCVSSLALPQVCKGLLSGVRDWFTDFYLFIFFVKLCILLVLMTPFYTLYHSSLSYLFTMNTFDAVMWSVAWKFTPLKPPPPIHKSISTRILNEY